MASSATKQDYWWDRSALAKVAGAQARFGLAAAAATTIDLAIERARARSDKTPNGRWHSPTSPESARRLAFGPKPSVSWVRAGDCGTRQPATRNRGNTIEGWGPRSCRGHVRGSIVAFPVEPKREPTETQFGIVRAQFGIVPERSRSYRHDDTLHRVVVGSAPADRPDCAITLLRG